MTITLEQVSVRFQRRTVISNLSLSLTEKRIGVIGDNGSGKSTFVRLLNGLLLPDDGRVTVNGVDTKENGKAVRQMVGFLFQNPDNQIVMPTVSEDLALGLKAHNVGPDVVQQRVAQTLEDFGISDLADRSAHFLSGGEKQLVALAGVMVTQPDILVCDEPTTLLDKRNTNHIAGMLDAVTCPLITVTHDVEQLEKYDRVLVFSDGEVIHDAEPGDATRFYLETLA